MAAPEVAPPEGFVEEDAAPPEGFIEESSPPAGFVEDASASSYPPENDSSPETGSLSKFLSEPNRDANEGKPLGGAPAGEQSFTESLKSVASNAPGSIYDEMNLGLLKPTDEEAGAIARLISPATNLLPDKAVNDIAGGTADTLEGVAKFATSPLGVGATGASMIAPEIVGAAFAVHGIQSFPDALEAIKNATDVRSMTVALEGLGLDIGMIAAPFLHAARPGSGGVGERTIAGSKDINVPEVSESAPVAEPLQEVARVTTDGMPPSPQIEAEQMLANMNPRMEQRIIGKDTQPLEPSAPSPNDYVPAIKVEGETVPGKAGETHKDILDRYIAENPDKAADALVGFDTKENPNFFLKGEDPVSREQLKETLGVSDSQGLREKQTAATPPPTVGEHLLPSKDVADILAEQPAEPGMKVPRPTTEEGAIFPSKKPSVRPIGDTPRGDKNWLRIPSALARAGRGLFTEGARHVLERTKNQVGQALAKATRRHVDLEQELYGQHEKILRTAQDAIPKAQREAAYTEAEQYFRDVENGRPAPAISKEAKSLVDAWYDVGEKTGNIARANNVQVNDQKTGGYRQIGHVKNYVPRMFRPEVEKVMADPQSDPVLFNKLADDLATKRGVTPDEAAKELRGVAGRFSSNDFMGNMELARTEQMPESFYDYDLRNLASRYLPSFSERMSQIISYGQRLGPREAPTRMNLWDIARRESEDAATQKWLSTAEDQATGFKPKDETDRNFARAQSLTTAALLSNPTSTVVRNLLSGVSATTETFGVRRALAEVKDAARAASRLDAKEIGAVREDMADFLHADQLGKNPFDEVIGKVTNKALKYSGFTGSETFVRTHNALTASSFARDAVAALTKNPKSGLSKEALALMKRWDVNPETVIAEKADWRNGPETRKFIRTAVREMQGGYKFDQVPLWANSAKGRFFYQYGRWGVQRAQNIFKNVVRQAIGEKVEFRGQQMTHRNVMPLIRMGLLAVGLGETFGGIASVLFGRDRRDASFKEIHETFNEDKKAAVGLAFERAINDVIMAGTLGIIGQPVDFLKSVKDQSRLKNPAEPPSAVGPKALVDLARKALDQRGTLTNRDLLDFAGQVVPGAKGLFDIGRHLTGGKLYEAQNDQRTLRNATRRWMLSTGKDMAGGGDPTRKTKLSPVYEKINDALLSGDAETAKKLAHEYYGQSGNPLKARQNLGASVKSRQPFRAGNMTSAATRHQFMEWAEKHLSKEDLEQVRRVQQNYMGTAYKAGIISPP